MKLARTARTAWTGPLIEIGVFARAVSEFLMATGLNVGYDAVKDAYARNAWRLRWSHEASRDPEVNVILYDRRGKEYPYGYIRVPGR
jgi:hypothetical protein